MDEPIDAVTKRRTFAIISHPDAGKTTLTEKLLLFGGAIQAAGAVKARGDARRARSDWMRWNRNAASRRLVGDDLRLRRLRLQPPRHPGHEDFSRNLSHPDRVDSAVMVIDAAKGIEERTRKLFEVCRLRDVPIVTFINKMDREAREPFDILDEIEQALALDGAPASWPIGMGRDFLGCYDLLHDRLALLHRKGRGELPDAARSAKPFRPKLDALPATPSPPCANRWRWRAACARTSTSNRTAPGT